MTNELYEQLQAQARADYDQRQAEKSANYDADARSVLGDSYTGTSSERDAYRSVRDSGYSNNDIYEALRAGYSWNEIKGVAPQRQYGHRTSKSFGKATTANNSGNASNNTTWSAPSYNKSNPWRETKQKSTLDKFKEYYPGQSWEGLTEEQLQAYVDKFEQNNQSFVEKATPSPREEFMNIYGYAAPDYMSMDDVYKGLGRPNPETIMNSNHDTSAYWTSDQRQQEYLDQFRADYDKIKAQYPKATDAVIADIIVFNEKEKGDSPYLRWLETNAG